MEIKDIFVGKAKKLFYRRLPVAQVAEDYTEKDIVNDETYFLVRLKEMYLRNTRILLRKYYPMLHTFAAYSGQEVHSISGPGQLRELGDRNLDRLVNLNTRLTETAPYKGGDVDVLVGLYTVPGKDAGKVLIDTLSSVAGLAGPAVGQAAQIATLIKSGVESILGLDEAGLQLGIRDTFFSGNPFRSGYYVGINGPAGEINLDHLWLRGGQLYAGSDPLRAKPYDDYDYMVLELEHAGDSRDDWPRLPGLAEMNSVFAQVMADETTTPDQKRDELGKKWPHFQAALDQSPYLVRPDRLRIAKSVSDRLRESLTAMSDESNPFIEARGWGDGPARQLSPNHFDLVDVADTFDPRDAASVWQADAALKGNPFR